jgi:hypothetical protein
MLKITVSEHRVSYGNSPTNAYSVEYDHFYARVHISFCFRLNIMLFYEKILFHPYLFSSFL